MTIFLSLFIINVYAQIAIDKVEKDGSRTIITKEKWINGNESASIGCIISPDGKNSVYVLIMKVHKMEIDEGRKLLLKFKDESIMELKNRKKIGPLDYVWWSYLTSRICSVLPEYVLMEEDIDKIIQNDVVKMRLENNIEYIDLKCKKFSKVIKEQYESINSVKSKKNGIYDGF